MIGFILCFCVVLLLVLNLVSLVFHWKEQEMIIDNDVEISRLWDENHKLRIELDELQKNIKLIDHKMNYVLNIVGNDDEEEEGLL